MSREPTHPATNRTMTLSSTTTLVDTTAANPYNVGAILPVEAFCEPDRLSPTRAIVLYDFDPTGYKMHPSSTGVEYLRLFKGEPVYMRPTRRHPLGAERVRGDDVRGLETEIIAGYYDLLGLMVLRGEPGAKQHYRHRQQ